jgi:4-carboxymuconolactone decarboxylase
MARIPGLEPHEVGWLTRLIYWLARRKIGQLTGQHRLVEPIKIAAHHPRLFRAVGQMEMGQGAARSVPDRLKTLASVQAAALIGCPY